MPVPTNNKIEVKKTSLAPISVIFFGGNYLGSKLAEKLLEKDSRVVIVDKFDPDKEFHFINLRDNPKLLMVNADLEKGIPQELSTVDYVYFLNYFDYFNKETKVKIIETAQYTKNIINFCVKADAKFTFVSNVDVKNDSLRKMFDNQRLIQEIIRESEEAKTLNFREISLPIIYGPRMILENSGSLIRILDEYINGTVITLDDENKNKDFYIYIDDAVNAIIKATFSENSKDKIITVTEKDGISEMEIGSIIKSLATRHLNLNYTETKDKLKWSIPEERNLHLIGYAPKENIRGGIIKTLSYYGLETNTFSFKPGKLIEETRDEVSASIKKKAEMEDKIEEINSKTNGYTNISYQKYKRSASKVKKSGGKGDFGYLILTVILTFILVFVVFPIGTIYFNYSNAKSNIYELKNRLGQGDLNGVREMSDKTAKDIDSALFNFNKFKFLFLLVRSEEKFEQYEDLLLSLKSFNQGINNFTYGVSPYLELSKSIKEGKELNPEVFKESAKNLEISYEYFDNANKILKGKIVDVDFGSEEITRYKNTLPKVVKLNEILLATSKDAENIFGFNEPTKILVLFQNQAEIRPTGGFIGSYGVLEISKGKIIAIKIDDIYNPDGQIDVKKINIAPPESIRKALNENKLYIRNSNYNSDFPSSADNVSNLFLQATGEQFKTVIAIDSTFIQSYLDQFGGIYLNAYEEEINATNFTERAQFHSEFNYKEGVSEKKSFLTNLGSKILEKFFEFNSSDIVKFSDAVYGLLETKNIQIATKYPNLSKSLKNLNWDGALVQTKGDYLKIVNSNLGGNKVNYMTKNRYKYEVLSMTRDGLLRARVTASYTNDSKTKAWPYGSFINYYKILTQKGTKLTGAKVVIDGKEENIFSNVKISSEGVYQTFEGNIEIEPQKTVILVLEYDLPSNLSIVKNSNTRYSLYWQKQSGENNEIEFVFNPPYGFYFGEVDGNLDYTKTEENVGFTSKQTYDYQLNIELTNNSK